MKPSKNLKPNSKILNGHSNGSPDEKIAEHEIYELYSLKKESFTFIKLVYVVFRIFEKSITSFH